MFAEGDAYEKRDGLVSGVFQDSKSVKGIKISPDELKRWKEGDQGQAERLKKAKRKNSPNIKKSKKVPTDSDEETK